MEKNNDLEVLSEQEGFVIKDDSAADWAIRKIAEERAEFARLEALAKERINSIVLKLDASKERLESTENYFGGLLEAYFETVKRKSTKTQESYQLLSGKLKRKTVKAKAERDDESLVDWLLNNGYSEYTKAKRSPAWAELSKVVDLSSGQAVFIETGEVIDGIKVTPESSKFVIETE